MNDRQKAVFDLYRTGQTRPPKGPLGSAWSRGFAGLPSIYHPDSNVFAAWKAGQSAKAGQTSVPDLAAAVLDELMGKPVDHLKTRRDNRP